MHCDLVSAASKNILLHCYESFVRARGCCHVFLRRSSYFSKPCIHHSVIDHLLEHLPEVCVECILRVSIYVLYLSICCIFDEQSHSQEVKGKYVEEAKRLLKMSIIHVDSPDVGLDAFDADVSCC